MRSSCFKALAAVLIAFGLSAAQSNGTPVKRVFYDGIGGTAVSDMVNAKDADGRQVFPDGPNVDGSALRTVELTEFLEGGTDVGDDFGSMIQGYVEAPQTGDYIFWIASDDDSELWLSTDNNPATKQRIAWVNGWTSSRAWDWYASQQSAPISLQRGRSYYFQVLHKEGGGGDNIAVGWQLPDGTQQRPLPLASVQPAPDPSLTIPSFVKDLANVTVDEKTVLTLSVQVNATPGSYQWYKSFAPIPDIPIPDAVMSSYTFKPTLADNNLRFRVLVGTGQGLLMSKTMILKVTQDVTLPTLTAASSSISDPMTVKVTFCEPVDPKSATDVANYAIDNGAEIYGAVTGSAANQVLLFTSVLVSKVNYTVTANNVLDLATVPNKANNTQASFKFFDVLEYKIYDWIGGTKTNDILNNVRYQTGDFNRTILVTELESPWEIANDFIGQIQAYLTPPETGDYKFSIYADDAAMIFLSTDDNPANKKVIAAYNGWTSWRQYTKYNDPDRFQTSAAIALEAGKRYFIEAVFKEGGGGDGLGVAWQRPGGDAVKNGDPPIPGDYLSAYKTMGPVVVTNQPKSTTVVEGASVSFSIGGNAVDGTPPYSYQWYKNGVSIPGATGTSITVPRTYSTDNGAVFNVLARNAFSMAASAGGVLTITPDTAPPTAQASGLYPNSVRVLFSEYVDAASAGNVANYALKSASGSDVSITGLEIIDEKTVKLLTGDLATGGLYTLTVKNIKDQSKAGNVMPETAVTVGAFNFADIVRINNSQAYGATPGGEKITIEAGGADIWGSSDQFVYAHSQVTGNFDYKLRIHSLDKSDNWAKAGLMARLTLDKGSRNVSLLATPASGQNTYSMQWRDTADSSSGSGGGSKGSVTRPYVNYPNTWLRLQRVGSVFYSFWSKDGVNWTLIQSKDTAPNGAYPNTVYLGIAVTSHTTSRTAKAVVSDYGPIPSVPVTFPTDISSKSITEQRSTTLSVVAAGSSPYYYQWQRLAPGATDWENISGATSASYTTPRLTLASNGAKYRVVVTNPYATFTSSEATVTITPDTVAPKILEATALYADRKVVLRFDEAVGSSALTTGNYRIAAPYRGSISGASLRMDGSYVVLSVNLPIPTNVVITASNVSDLAGNLTTATVTAAFLPLRSRDVGAYDAVERKFTDPLEPGTAYPLTSTAFEVIAGGSDIWNNADGFHFVYQELEGDFDIRVRVESLQFVNNWSKAGLMVREDLDAGSRNLNMVVDPAQGANLWEQNYRATKDGSSSGWPNASSVGPVTYPNAWVRIIRYGETFTAMRSSDGVVWNERGKLTPDPVYPSKILVGLATTSHNNDSNMTARAVYSGLQIKPITQPVLVSAVGTPSLNKVTVIFTEAVTKASATDLANYAISGGLTITAASIDASGTKVTLTTSAQSPGALYTLTVNNVKNDQGIAIKANSRKSFSAWVMSQGFLIREVWNGIGDPLSNLKGSSKYPDQPDSVGFISKFETPSNVADTYSQRVYGYITPPVSGDYTFYIASDDQGELYLSTDANPANKTLIASVNGWAGIREWNREANQKSAAKTLEAGKTYYIEALHSEGGGGDNLAVAWTLPGVTEAPANGSAPVSGLYLASYANPDLAVLAITTQPQNVSLQENRQASLSVGIYTSHSAVLYQWQVQAPGSADWVNIAGANDASYTTKKLTLADNGIKYRAVVYIPGTSRTSTAATVTVNKDVTPPQIVAIGTLLNSKNITVRFDEELDATSAKAFDNYLLFGAGNLTGVSLRPDNKTVILTADQPVTSRVVVYVENIKDLVGNATSMLKSSRIIGMIGQDVGTVVGGAFTDPITPGAAYAVTDTEFEVVAGGTDIWSNADGFHFVYKEVTGDFDVRVRVESLGYANHWSKAGLMVRESLQGGSRNVNMVVDPTLGANVWEQNHRATTDGSSSGWPDTSQIGPVTYPNAWVRITRAGNTFTALRSSNGVDWEQRGQITQAYPAKVLVGMGTTAHDNAPGVTTTAKYSDFKLLSSTTGPAMSIEKVGDNIVISWPTAFTDGFVLEGGSPTDGWAPVDAPVEVSDEVNSVTLPIGSNKKLYRLVK